MFWRIRSGKSTLLLAFLRLLDIKSGTIKVDGVDLSLVPRSLIRQRCFITVSQDLFVLPQASLRLNLDVRKPLSTFITIRRERNLLNCPFTQPSASLLDETIVAALQRTCLWSHFIAGDSVPREPRHILDSSIASLPQMSTGQSQLFAVARAILQLQSLHDTPSSSAYQPHSRQIMPILLLDEATSSLDLETESTIRRIIRHEFIEKGHTVIAITHRLSGMTESMRSGQDIVALLSKGKVEKIGWVEDALGMTAPQK